MNVVSRIENNQFGSNKKAKTSTPSIKDTKRCTALKKCRNCGKEAGCAKKICSGCNTPFIFKSPSKKVPTEEVEEVEELKEEEYSDVEDNHFIVPSFYVGDLLCCYCYETKERRKMMINGKMVKCYLFKRWPNCLKRK